MNNEKHVAESRDSDDLGALLTVALVVVLILLGILPFYLTEGPFRFKAGLATSLLGVYLVLWSVLVMVSTLHPQRAIIFRAIDWLATHAVVPRTRWNSHILSAAFFIIGTYVILIGGGVIET